MAKVLLPERSNVFVHVAGVHIRALLGLPTPHTDAKNQCAPKPYMDTCCMQTVKHLFPLGFSPTLSCRDRPELSEALCEEMMTRQLELADKVSQHPVLTCLSPWMENLTIAAHWKGTWCERLLKSMYYVTLR